MLRDVAERLAELDGLDPALTENPDPFEAREPARVKGARRDGRWSTGGVDRDALVATEAQLDGAGDERHVRAPRTEHQLGRLAACKCIAPDTPFSSTGPISRKVTSDPIAASRTAWLTRTSPGRAYSAIRDATLTVCP